MNSYSIIILIILIHLINHMILCDLIHFHTKTRSTRLVNRTLLGTTTECSIRLGGKQFTLKFYKMITCRYVEDLSSIYSYVNKYSDDITALEITDSIIKYWNIDQYSNVFHNIEYLIFHRTKIETNTTCQLNFLSKKLFYLHLTKFSPSLDHLFSNQSCSLMRRLHVLILDQTILGNENILLKYFPNLHILRLNFSSFHRPLNYSYIRSFRYLHDFLLNVNDDCHRCEYEWLKYAARDEKYLLFRLSPNSGCMDWNRGGKFLTWEHAPLCGSCSIPIIINKVKTNDLCTMEDGITEYYCKAFYGQNAAFQPWTTRYNIKIINIVPLSSTMRPNREFMKSKYTNSIIKRNKRDQNTTFATTTQFLSTDNESNVIPSPSITNSTTISPWQLRHVVTRNPTDLFNRSYCHSIDNSSYRPKVHSNDPPLIQQLFNISQKYSPNCSNIQCDITNSDYAGPICLKNGQTYSNLCEILVLFCTKQLDPYKLQIDYFGPCEENCSLVKQCYAEDEICMMTTKPHCIRRQKNCTGFSPVCDIHGKTFINQCHLLNSLKLSQARQLAYRGPCRLNRMCSSNLCQSNEVCVQTQDQYHYPVCLNCNSNSTIKECPFELFCGDNKKQYINRCQLHNDRCQTKTFIQIEYFGQCRQQDYDEYETVN